MGSVTSYDTAAGKRYRARYRKPDHSESQKRGFKTKREAELFIASVSVSKARGEYIDASAARITVGALATTWLANRTHLKPSTARVEESTYRVHVLPRWGGTSIAAVSHSDIQAWVASIGKSPTIVRHSYAILSAILEAAVRDKRLPSNPAHKIRLPRKVGKERVYLSHHQVQALAKQSRDKSTLILVLAYCGLRWGEATGLRVRDLDALKRRLTVRENAVAVGGKIIVGTPKSHKVRSVPFPAFLSSPLADLADGKEPDSILFGDGENYQRSPDTRDGWFSGACKRVRKADPSFPAHLTLHELRHTAASLSISAGANVKAVQRMLGHASAAMTLDTYADLFEDDLDAVSAALDKAAQESFVAKKRPNEEIRT
jgi:integrase